MCQFRGLLSVSLAFYQAFSLPLDVRLGDLLVRMTFDDKIAQTIQPTQSPIPVSDVEGSLPGTDLAAPGLFPGTIPWLVGRTSPDPICMRQ
jgi:hypothetical protein